MTMHRARRLAALVVAAAVAVPGLAACQAQPTVAAYATSGNITVAQVQRIYQDALQKHQRDAAREAAQAQPGAPKPPAEALSLTGEQVLSTLVSHELLSKIAARHSVQLPSPLPMD